MLHPRTGRPRGGPILLALGIVLAVAACSSRASGTTPPVAGNPKPAASAVATATTKMICEPEVEQDLVQAVGRATVRPVTPSWTDDVYSCAYEYSDGTLTLSVKQLPDSASTQSYFTSLAARRGRVRQLDGLGEGAFTTPDGSVVVRKDDKVLVVDIRRLPRQFGVPQDTRADVAITVAATIMGCWTGS
jgi:hypothetical protein